MTPANIQKGFIATGIWPLNREAMDDKMGPSEVFVNAPDMANEEEVGDEHVEEVLGERVPQTQRDGIQYMVALKDDEEDTMQGVHEGVEMGEQDTDGVCTVSQELDGVDPNATLRLTSILALPQTVSIPRRNRGTPFIDYSKSIIMTSDEYIAALEQKQERREEVSREKEKRKANLEINKNRKAKEKKQKAEEKKMKAEERAEEHGVMWPTKRCIEVGVKLHEAIRD